MKRTVHLNRDDYKKSIKFAMMLWHAEKSKDEWRSTGIKRDIGKYITDHALGKLAEIAFAKFLEINWGIKAELDFDVYPGAFTIDRGDLAFIEISGTKKMPEIQVDIKSTKLGSVWAMVDLTEFNNRRYDAYIWVKVGLPLNRLAWPIFEAIRDGNLAEIEYAVPTLEKIDAEITGFAYRKEIEKWREIYRGEAVIDPTNAEKMLFTAKTDNKACPIHKLRNADSEWSGLTQKITGA